MYRPKGINELRTAAQLLKPTAPTGGGTYTQYNGVNVPNYPATGEVIYINFKSYGGTENAVNGVISYIDTALITTWYRSDITADCLIKLESGAKYRIISPPENVELQGRYMTFKVERVKGS